MDRPKGASEAADAAIKTANVMGFVPRSVTKKQKPVQQSRLAISAETPASASSPKPAGGKSTGKKTQDDFRKLMGLK